MNVIIILGLGALFGAWKTGMFKQIEIKNEIKNPVLVSKELTPELFAKKHGISTDESDNTKDSSTNNK